METYRPNSHKAREGAAKENSPGGKKVIEKAISGTARTRKKGTMEKLAGAIIQEDAKSVKEYIFIDVLVPAIKKAISDVVTNGIDMVLYGESRGGRERRPTYTSYGRHAAAESRRKERARRGNGYDPDDVVVNTRGEAEEVLAQMDGLIDTYGVASVADLYDLVGITGSYTDNNYGWTDTRGARAARVRDGYAVRMPRPLPLD